MLSLFGKEAKKDPSLLDRLKESVSKTRTTLAARVEEILGGERRIDPARLRELETALLAADIGVRTCGEILETVRAKLERQGLSSAAELKEEIKSQLVSILTAPESAGAAPASADGAGPRVFFIVGVNGSGKTTSIGKLAHRLRQEVGAAPVKIGDLRPVRRDIDEVRVS